MKKCKSVDDKLNKLINLQMDGKLKKKDVRKNIKNYCDIKIQKLFNSLLNKN